MVDIVKNGDQIEKVRVRVLPNNDENIKNEVHWVSKEHSIDATVRLYNRLFLTPYVGEDFE